MMMLLQQAAGGAPDIGAKYPVLVPFLAAVEDGPLSATQFHPEKSGDAGAVLLGNWVGALG